MNKTKTLTILEYKLPITVKRDKTGGYIARCRNWDDCYAQGETLEDALNELSGVASSLIELYKEEGLKIPLTLVKTRQNTAASLSFTVPLVVSA